MTLYPALICPNFFPFIDNILSYRVIMFLSVIDIKINTREAYNIEMFPNISNSNTQVSVKSTRNGYVFIK